jgi:predicted transcriptional regulator of viral defense system
MQNLYAIFQSHGGYAYLQDLKEIGIHTKTISKALDDGIIEKLKPGLYRWIDMPMVAHQGFFDVALAVPKAVICLHSALAYYELTLTQPSLIMAAIPREAKPPKYFYPPAEIFYFSHHLYSLGADTIFERSSHFAIYDREKTIIDCFRFRKKLGEDVAVEGIRNYLKSRRPNLNTLFEYAQKARMERIIKPYVGALIG